MMSANEIQRHIHPVLVNFIMHNMVMQQVPRIMISWDFVSG